MLHTGFEILGQEGLCDIHALKLLHSVKLLLSLLTSVIKGLILLLDSRDFFLDLLLPIRILELPPLVVFVFELTNFFKFVFFLYLKSSLFNRLVEQHIENWLDLHIIVKKVIVLNLSDLVNSCFLRDVFWGWWFRLENICLQFHFCFIRLSLPLFSQEVGEINLDPSRWAWSQVVGAGCIL